MVHARENEIRSGRQVTVPFVFATRPGRESCNNAVSVKRGGVHSSYLANADRRLERVLYGLFWGGVKV